MNATIPAAKMAELEALAVMKLRQFLPDPRIRIHPAAYGTSGPQIAIFAANKSDDERPEYIDVQLFSLRYLMNGPVIGDDMTFDELQQLGLINIDPRTLSGPKNPDPNDPARQPGFIPGPGTPEHRARLLAGDNLPTPPPFPSASNDPHGL